MVKQNNVEIEEVKVDKVNKEKKETENLLDDNIFILKLKIGKDIGLKPYALSVQTKLMTSGMLNRLMKLQKVCPQGKVSINEIDYTQLGELIELAVKIIHEMLPKGVQLKTEKEQLIDDVIEGEPMRFINWLMTQFGKSNAFLAPENPVEVVNPE